MASIKNISRPSPEANRLLKYLAPAYVALIVYASLHPFSGWHDPGLSPFAFLEAGWPHYWTAFDIGINLLAYFPLGFLLMLAGQHHPSRSFTLIATTLFGAGISFSMETIQFWLPSRVPSDLDLLCNTAGTVLGALFAGWQGKRISQDIARLQRPLLPVPHVEAVLVLVGLWLLTLLSPETFLFGAGDLRQLLAITPTLSYAPSSFFAIETGIIVCNTVAIGLIVRALFSAQRSPLILLCAFFTLALTIRTLAAAILVGPLQALIWLTPGAGLGLMIGGAALSVLLLLPPAWRIAFAGLALMAGTVLVNLAPPNPYSTAAMATWRQGHFLNFNGLTRLTASLWPFLALPCLTLLGRRR